MPTRLVFHEGLRTLEDDLMDLGAMAHSAVGEAVGAALAGDADRARAVCEGDRALNDRYARIEHRAVALIATQQPAAGDLREILAILGIAVDLERVGDHAKAIANESLRGGHPLPEEALPALRVLLDAVRAMLRDALASLRDRDAEAAEALRDRDAEVDGLFHEIRDALVEGMTAHPQAIPQLQAAEWCAKSLERVADHATNIGERVVYLVTGRVVELNA